MSEMEILLRFIMKYSAPRVAPKGLLGFILLPFKRRLSVLLPEAHGPRMVKLFLIGIFGCRELVVKMMMYRSGFGC